jgi:hypothetical protein
MSFETYTNSAQSRQAAPPPVSPIEYATSKLRSQNAFHASTYNSDENIHFRQTLLDTAAYLQSNNAPLQDHTLVIPGGSIMSRWDNQRGERTIGVDHKGWLLTAPAGVIFSPSDIYTSVDTPNRAFLRQDGLAINFMDTGLTYAIPVSDSYFGNEVQGISPQNPLEFTQIIEFQEILYATRVFALWHQQAWMRNTRPDEFSVANDELFFTEKISDYDTTKPRKRSFPEYMATLAVETVRHHRSGEKP